jgi:ATP-dependent helicase HepA
MAWKKDQLIWIEADQGVGPAKIVDDSDPSFFRVESLSEERLSRNYTRRNPPFKRVQLDVGQKLRVASRSDEITLQHVELRGEIYHFSSADGQSYSEAEVISISTGVGVTDLLRQAKFSPPKLFSLRREAWQLLAERSAHPLKGAAGCRVELLPHQIWVVAESLKMPQVRVLLADEVGLGKTIEAGLIFSALHARNKLKKVLVLVPPALKVQWLTESFRRFNVRFRLDHEELIDDDEFRDFIIASLDEVGRNNDDFDLLIVDEAHRLVHDASRAQELENLVKRSKHVLFLSATPRVHGDAEFLRMMLILGSGPTGRSETRLFQSRRKELGLPSFRRLEAALVTDKKAWLFDFLKSRVGLAPFEKVFLICSKASEVMALAAELKKKFGENFALFHEEMDLVERDRQAAYFADPEGAQILISSEIGGEGRNFQFCRDMILFDLPRDPLIVEQRIGRLDRLGQKYPVRVWCPVLQESAEEEVFETLRDRFRVFDEPWSGSGLDDVAEEALLGQPAETTSLESLQSAGAFQKLPFDGAEAQALVQSLRHLSDTDIQDFLERLYDLYGVEVEDFDTRGNWKIALSSLTFVEYFPGLGSGGERVISFDRSQALAREDMSFFSLDHPDVIESMETLLSSEQGKLCCAHLPEGERADILFWGLRESLRTASKHELLWSCSTKRELPVKEGFLESLEPVKPALLQPAFLKALGGALQELLDTQATTELDSLMILIPR